MYIIIGYIYVRIFLSPVDSTFLDLKKAFLATGCGNWKHTGKLPATNKLLLQIFLLKEGGEKSWKETGFLTKIVGEFQQNRLRCLTEKCVKEVKKFDASVPFSTKWLMWIILKII